MNETNVKPRLSASEVRELLVRAVEEKGADYVYPPEIEERAGYCMYVADGAPSCIVGHVYYYAGVDLATIASFEGQTPDTGSPLAMPENVASALVAAQSVQDSGETWGEALAAFDASLAEESW